MTREASRERRSGKFETDSIEQLWEQARAIDPTLKVTPHQLLALRRRRLRPVAFSRDLLFGAMARGQPILFSDLSVPVRGEEELGVPNAVLQAMRAGFPRRRTICVRSGPSGTEKHVVLDELLRRWTTNSGKISVTDLHIRKTGIKNHIDCSRLCDFNLLAEATGDIHRQEMLTMVVSSAGTFTDSHSDDPDGSNHCFTGKKLWLAWDTFRGLSRKLDDVERVDVPGPRARFDISTFLAVPGSCWFTVEQGQTLFLPGHLTHKVITLENYLGVGSFFVMLPSYLRTLSRWSRHTPLWALNAPRHRRLQLVDKITRRVTRKVNSLAAANEHEQARWGLNYLCSTLDEHLASGPRTKSILLGNPASVQLVNSVRHACAMRATAWTSLAGRG